jgi:two-component sensor histidine kinase
MQQVDHPQKIEIRDYLHRVVDSLIATHRHPHLQVSFNLDILQLTCSSQTGMNVAQLVKELIHNSLRHGYKGRTHATISITLTQKENGYSLIVADDGNGMNEETDPYRSTSSGLQLVAIFVENLKGNLSVIRSHGTRFEINFSIT